jgi:hypothetical protein
MRTGLRFRPIGWIAAIATLVAMGATLAVAASGGAAAGPLKVKEVNFEAACILAPGVLNETATIKVHQTGEAPETLEKGESFTLANDRITVTTPAHWGEVFFASGSRTVKGSLTGLIIDAHNAEPPTMKIGPVPIKAPVTGGPIEFTAPAEGTLNLGPWKVTGKTGEEVVLSIDTAPGFKEVSTGHYEGTGQGILAELTGFNEAGEANVGPLQVACTAPANVVIYEAKITGEGNPPTTTTTTTTTTIDTTPLTTETSTTTTTTHIGCPGLCPVLSDKLTGSVTVHKLGQKITLPEGCTFRGIAEVPGALEANTKCPPFAAPIKILVLPTTIGLNLTESEPVKGKIEVEEGPTTKLRMTGTARDNIEITSLSVFGLKLPLSCTTAEPVVFALNGSATPQELITIGVTSNGETTLPAVRCNGFLGGIAGSLLTLLMSGPNNPYALTIAP